ncbi:CD276 antigen-like [Gambusia affinis]|uniref:CD276 antigen-like n=1 Tax=Gambusia affinis TaxID=33528 RepID=UPI001CDC21E8|nr:CD276 antigen-like [Gambusia affinis]
MSETFYFNLFMFFLLSVSGSDPEVSCVFRQSCMLPCQIQSGSDPLIHWYQVTSEDNLVHSYYSGRDQMGYQNQNFQNRTSLFQDQISRGNASLLLKEVKIQDEGRYKCYTSTIRGFKESFINMKTEAPVSDIRIHQDGNRITCSSEGIYPQPELTWSTEPPSNTTLNESTRIQETEDQLYNISSSLMVPDNETDWTYSCTIRTRSNNMTETFKKSDKEDFLFWVLIGGLAAAGVALLIITVMIIRCLCKRVKNKKSKTGSASDGNPENRESFEKTPLNGNIQGSDIQKESSEQENTEDATEEKSSERDPLKTE